MNKIILLLTSLLIALTNIAQAEIKSTIINYKVASQPFQGYLSYDDAIPGKRPGVIVVHEWWGHNAYARKRADMLAKMGYTAFALDMYGTGKLAKHPDDAKKFMQATLANMNIAEARFNTAMALLQKHPTVMPKKIAAIGYCFGGGTVLHMARAGTSLAGVVSFHGSLASKITAKMGKITAEMLVLNGEDDPFVTTEQINIFKKEMNQAAVSLEFINYPKAKHSFTNPNANAVGKKFEMPLAYNEKADKDSWQRMRTFLARIFKNNNTPPEKIGTETKK